MSSHETLRPASGLYSDINKDIFHCPDQPSSSLDPDKCSGVHEDSYLYRNRKSESPKTMNLISGMHKDLNIHCSPRKKCLLYTNSLRLQSDTSKESRNRCCQCHKNVNNQCANSANSYTEIYKNLSYLNTDAYRNLKSRCPNLLRLIQYTQEDMANLIDLNTTQRDFLKLIYSKCHDHSNVRNKCFKTRTCHNSHSDLRISNFPSSHHYDAHKHLKSLCPNLLRLLKLDISDLDAQCPNLAGLRHMTRSLFKRIT